MSRLSAIDQILEPVRPLIYTFLFLALASLQCVVIALILPAMQGPDEGAHSARANAIMLGQFVGIELKKGQFGGLVDKALVQVEPEARYLRSRRNLTVDLELDARLRSVRWTGETEPKGFTNTVIGSPALYLPSVAGMMVGKKIGLPLLASLKVGRLLNAAVYVLVSAAAIAFAGSAAPFLFVLLTLPMSASVGSSITPDGPIIATAALGVVLIMNAMKRESNVRAGEAPSGRQTVAFFGATAAILLAALGKSPYVLLVVLLFCATAIPLRQRIVAIVVALAISIAWHTHAALLGIIWPGDPAAQIAYLASNPLAIFTVAAETLRERWQGYLQQLIGMLGWLDTPVPYWFVILSIAVLATTLASILFGRVFTRDDIIKGPSPVL